VNNHVDVSLLEPIYKLVQECLSLAPVIILGSGHSCAFGIPGMAELADYLRCEIPKQIAAEDQEAWKLLEERIQRVSLEEALRETPLSPQLTNLVIETTWDYVFPADRRVLDRIIQDRQYLPLSRLYRYLFNSTQRRIQVITTNYDCLAEYAADAVGCAWATGFAYGYIGDRYGNQPLTVLKGNIPFRTVDIWKVHGSINWYRGPDAATYYLPAAITMIPGYSSVIVTPGIDKYRRTHKEPFRTIIAGADSAMDAGNSFLCVGYGFNDEHVQPKFLEKCQREEKLIVVLAMKLTEAAKTALFDGHCRRFVAFEQSSEGTRVFSPEYQGGIQLPGINLWSLGELLNQVI
jgi:hypothetical protein